MCPCLFPAPFSEVVFFPASWAFWVSLLLGILPFLSSNSFFLSFGATFAEVARSFTKRALGVLVGVDAIRQQIAIFGGRRGHSGGWQIVRLTPPLR